MRLFLCYCFILGVELKLGMYEGLRGLEVNGGAFLVSQGEFVYSVKCINWCYVLCFTCNGQSQH